jgi:hypothetical protein
MMTQDSGIEAKEAAVRDVTKLLPDSLASMRSDYAAHQQVCNFLFLFLR